MSLFGKKEKDIRVVFYEGNLPGFIVNKGCKLMLEEDKLFLKQIEPKVEVSFDEKRISSIELLSEQDYMKKYKGNAGNPLKKGEIAKIYYVFNYIGKNNENIKFVVWVTTTEGLKMTKLRERILRNLEPMKYEI